jgi:hypothetical protein
VGGTATATTTTGPTASKTSTGSGDDARQLSSIRDRHAVDIVGDFHR